MMMLDTDRIEITDMKSLLQEDRCKAFELFYNKYASMIYGLVVKGLGENENGNKIFEKIITSAWDKICNHELETHRCLIYVLTLLRKHVNNASSKIHLTSNPERENIFELSIINGYTIEDIANKFNCTAEEARRELRKSLKQLNVEY